jgi:Rps23 Pro-64 3,4-dihydroxylase Tpa1-like proline 4-hydroxylase
MKLPLLNEIDIDALRLQMASSSAFPYFCVDNFLDDAFANEVHDAFPSYADAEKIGETFKAVNEKMKIQIADSSKFPPSILKLHELLASQEFVDAMSEMTGIKNLIADPALLGGGIHETNSGGHLDVHIDFNYDKRSLLHRRLNILIYFNKDWPEEYGGYLDLWDKDVKECQGRFAPIFNRAVGFVTSEVSWHGVTPITCPSDKFRKSFAVYYYTKEAPEGWDGTAHSTMFKAWPTEYWKGNVAMPAEALARAARDTVNSAKQQVKKLLGR